MSNTILNNNFDYNRKKINKEFQLYSEDACKVGNRRGFEIKMNTFI